MQRSITLLVLFCALALCQPFPGFAQTRNAKSVVSAINAYVAEVDRFTKTNSKHRIFGDVSSALADENDLWKEFKSEKELEAAGTGENLNQSAFVWTRKSEVVAAKFTFTSPSGDWNHFINYYFREDGSLAKIEAQLNTFYGNISVIRHRYYNPDGRLIKSTRRILDLDTHRPKKAADFTDNPIPVYFHVPEIPFRKLL